MFLLRLNLIFLRCLELQVKVPSSVLYSLASYLSTACTSVCRCRGLSVCHHGIGAEYLPVLMSTYPWRGHRSIHHGPRSPRHPRTRHIMGDHNITRALSARPPTTHHTTTRSSRNTAPTSSYLTTFRVGPRG